MITVTINITIGHSKKVLSELKPISPWSVFLRYRRTEWDCAKVLKWSSRPWTLALANPTKDPSLSPHILSELRNQRVLHWCVWCNPLRDITFLICFSTNVLLMGPQVLFHDSSPTASGQRRLISVSNIWSVTLLFANYPAVKEEQWRMSS